MATFLIERSHKRIFNGHEILYQVNEGDRKLPDITRIGEEAVVSHLTSKGWSDVRLNTHGASLPDIEAMNPHGELQLLYVKTAVFPFAPTDISDVEKATAKARASRIGASAFVAKAQLNKNYVIQTISYLQL